MSEQSDTPMGRIMGKWPGDFDDSPPVSPSFQSVGKVRIVSEEFYAEHERMRDLLRWRDAEKEKPESSGRYLVATDGSTDISEHIAYYSPLIGWSTKDANIEWWRPIGPLPGGE